MFYYNLFYQNKKQLRNMIKYKKKKKNKKKKNKKKKNNNNYQIKNLITNYLILMIIREIMFLHI